MIHSPDVLTSMDDLPTSSKISVFGAGETGQEFARRLRRVRPDVEITCFIDSFRDGSCDGIDIRKPSHIADLSDNTGIVIASVFWNEISELISKSFSRRCKILSNELINQSSHLSSYGPFYFERDESVFLEERLCSISERLRSDLDRDIFRKAFDLRVYRREREFFKFADEIVRQQRKSFETKDKYSMHLDLKSVGYAIEGGVFDGQDTYRLLEALKKNGNFKKMYAFDPFLDSFRRGQYFKKIDQSLCEFNEQVLWDREEEIAFSVDKENPANSKVVRGTDIKGDSKKCSAVTVDKFLEKTGTPVDLIKLDVEGSENNVLDGARKSILKHRPTLAISIYHRKEHLLEIPEYLLSLHDDYKFSISINNPTFVDMVLYAS